MAWIDVIEEEEADGELAEVYEQIASERGKVANIMQVHSLQPQTMLDHMELYTTLMFSDSEIGREEREMVATVVSRTNGCEYCVQHHATALNAYWRDEARLEAFITDWRSLELSERQTAMLTYAETLTRSPTDTDEVDLDELRDVGLDDEQILQLNLIVSYFNFVNRIAEGLGVEFTPDEQSGYNY